MNSLLPKYEVLYFLTILEVYLLSNNTDIAQNPDVCIRNVFFPTGLNFDLIIFVQLDNCDAYLYQDCSLEPKVITMLS